MDDTFNTRLVLAVIYVTVRILQAAFAKLIATVAAASAMPSATYEI